MAMLISHRYRLDEELRRGRLTTVYRGTDIREGNRAVIVKILDPQLTERESEATLRFLREARILSKLDHPHIVELLDVGQADDRYYLVTRYVEGRSLADLMCQIACTVEGIWTLAVHTSRALH